MIERDKRAVLIANNFFKSQLFFNKSYALRLEGTSRGADIVGGTCHPGVTTPSEIF